MEDGPLKEIVTKEVLYRRLEDAIREEDNNIMLAHARLQVLRSAICALDEYFADGGLTDQQLKERDEVEKENSKETPLKTLIDIRNVCRNTADCTECKYCVPDEYTCCFMNSTPSDWTSLEKVIKDDGKEG